jgi:hypothetical protein
MAGSDFEESFPGDRLSRALDCVNNPYCGSKTIDRIVSSFSESAKQSLHGVIHGGGSDRKAGDCILNSGFVRPPHPDF